MNWYGKKINTKTGEVVDDDYTRMTEKVQDHYVVTDATRESYVGEFTPEDGSGSGIGQGLLDYVEHQEGLSKEELEAIGGDSTPVNPGNKVRWRHVGTAFVEVKTRKKIKELKDPKIRRFRPIPCPDFPIIPQDVLKVQKDH